MTEKRNTPKNAKFTNLNQNNKIQDEQILLEIRLNKQLQEEKNKQQEESNKKQKQYRDWETK